MEAVAALDLFRRGNELRTPFRVRRESRSVVEEATLGNVATGYAVLGIDLDSLLLNKAVVLPRQVKDKDGVGKEEQSDQHKGLTISTNPREGAVGEMHSESTAYLRQVQPPLAGPRNSRQLQQGGAVAGAGMGGRGSVPSLLQPYSERRVLARGSGRVTAEAMREESDDKPIKEGHYTSCVLPPCLVFDPLVHPNTLPPHLQPAALLALREAGAIRHPVSEFTVPDYFKNDKLFVAFHRYY
ncbi:hypothetical protein E2C01_086946 [Portunus trituberculatus]|uniref:Uncharacterized protein n=2 Tax=Portunus trituberculatus TaxID=210409 RepID=A0A5B7JHR8_PORTR|nr:hypothetical protein [Portunus trituberculatus]